MSQLLKLTPKNYHTIESDRVYMSASQIGKWLKCAAAEFARQNSDNVEEDKNWSLGGRFCHMAILEPEKMYEFWEENPNFFFEKDMTHKELKELATDADVDLAGYMSSKQDTIDCLEKNEVFIPPPTLHIRSEYSWVDRCLESFRRQSVFMEMIDQGDKEQIITFEIDSVMFKARIDNLRDNGFDDLKFMKDFKDGYSATHESIAHWYSVFDYDRQMAIYQEAIKSISGAQLTPNILAVTKHTVPDVQWVRFDSQEMLDDQIEEVRRNLPAIIDWKTGEKTPPRCEECNYCKATKQIRHPLSALNPRDVL